MLRQLLFGSALALCASVVLLIGGGSDLEHVAVLGAALGGVVGLVPHNPALGKLGGFFLRGPHRKAPEKPPALAVGR